MSGNVTALDIFGTNEPVAERRILTAGPLTAVLEDGNLRTIRFAGVEVVRAINYLARDSSWGTYKAGLSDISVSESRNAFQVVYTGLVSGSQERFSYRMTILGDASGTLTLEAQGTALTDFPTNRTGFVVLHPADAAGGRLVIEHSDGCIEETTFPDTISPDQPAFDIAALSHELSPGLVCTVKMQGDVFEMEDQRNWTDASFKTYVRPLSRPRPYVIAKGSRDVQRITVSVRSPLAAAAPDGSRAATLSVGGSIGYMPSIALFLDPDDLAAAMANVSMMGLAQHVIVRFDVARGHDRSTLKEAGEFAAAIGARLAIEAIFAMIDPKAEAMHFAEAVRSSNIEPGAVLISPRREFTTRPSNTLPPGERPVGECVAALRAVGFHAHIGAGTASYFTEFNRNPPDGSPDFVFFGSAAIVHAADDISVMETIGVFPSMIASARKLCSARPVWLGPCTIGMRHNPYGPAVAENPTRARMPAAGDDPRHGALFGAAFVTGVAAQAAAAGVDHLIVASPIGRFGLFDSLGKRWPLQAVHAELATAAGAELYEVAIDRPGLAAIGFRRGESIRILIANLTSETIPLALPNGIAIAGLIDSTGALSMPSSSEARLGPFRTMVLNSVYDCAASKREKNMPAADYEILDPRFARLFNGSAHVEKLFTGCRWAEGPAWFAAGRYVVWSDIPNNRMLRYDETDGSVSVFRQPCGNSNGNTVDRQGRLVTCEHAGRRVSRTEHDGSITTIADRWQGKRLNSPNDVVMRSDGSVWFTDPAYGIETDYEGDKAESEIGACHVYRVDPNGSVEAIITDMVRPNGLAFSLDEKQLYVVDTGRTHGPQHPAHIRVFDVNERGKVSGGRVFADCTAGLFDGFRLDDVGRIWTSAEDGIHCYHPDGTLIGKVFVPEVVANCVFGGAKRNVLYICGTTSLYAVRLMVNGARTY